MRTLILIINGSLAALAGLTAAPLAAQQAPANLQATVAGPTTVSLTWNAATGATGYVVQRAIGSAVLDRLTPSKISGTAYTDAAAPAATALRYRIKAVYTGNGHTYSAIVNVTTPSAPASTASSTPTPPSTPAPTPAPTAPAAEPAQMVLGVAVPAQTPGLPVAASSPSTSAPATGRDGVPLPTGTPLEARPGSRALMSAPTGVAVSGTPLVADLTWDAMPNAQRYAVRREDGITAPVERTSANFTGREFQDTIPDPRITYRYVITAYYAGGISGDAQPVPFTSPPLLNPAGFSAKDLGDGKVSFQWQAVPGAKEYRLDGTGLPNTGQTAPTNSLTLTGVPAGPGSWNLVALYPGNFADYNSPSVVSQVVRVLPPHPLPWLSKSNGSGSLADALIYMNMPCPADKPGTSCGQWELSTWFWDAGLEVGGSDGYSPVQQDQIWNRDAVYANTADLGFGRRTVCAQSAKAPPRFFFTLCYASSHGAGPGEAGFADPAVTAEAARTRNATRTFTVITKDATGMRFMVFNPAGETGYGVPIFKPTPSANLDSQGSKFVPRSCMACHGGRYDPATQKVEGATLLPVNPSQLAFAHEPDGRAAQEEKIRKINAAVLLSSPSPAVAAYINGLYNGAVNQPGAHAVDDYVPSGWAEQPGLYRSIVGPYCATCHMAARADINFASYGNFINNAALIHTAVCVAHTMPHAEIPFRAFWTKDTGALYLPGLLAATLGYPGCP